MPVTVIALVSIVEEEPWALAEYFRVTAPLLKNAGAEIKKRFSVNEVIVGHRPARMVIMVEYPNRAAVSSVFDSAEYEAIKPIRDKAFSEYHVTIVSDETELESKSASTQK